MSTFDPGLEPPGDWQMPYDPPPPGPTGAGAAAAGYVWLCAALGLVMSGCCGIGGVIFALVPADEVMRQLPQDAPNREQVVQMLPMLPTIGTVMAVAAVVLMLLPALLLAVLGFKVRSGGRGASITAMIVLGVQGLALVFVLLMSLTGLLVTRVVAVADLVFIALTAGVLLLVGVTIAKLRASLSQRQTMESPPAGPWGV